jgi:hypothetical protein
MGKDGSHQSDESEGELQIDADKRWTLDLKKARKRFLCNRENNVDVAVTKNSASSSFSKTGHCRVPAHMTEEQLPLILYCYLGNWDRENWLGQLDLVHWIIIQNSAKFDSASGLSWRRT